MPLEITVLGPDGPKRAVPVPMEDHMDIQDAAAKHMCTLLPRMADYYVEAQYAPNELEALAAELRTVIPELAHSPAGYASQLLALVQEALAAGEVLFVLPD